MSAMSAATAAGVSPLRNLLTSLTVPPGLIISPKGLILIVGPNSSGKTQLLKDIQSVLTGQPRDLIVCSDFQLNKPPSHEELMNYLCDEGYFTWVRDQNGQELLRQTSPHLGSVPFRGHNVHRNYVPGWFASMPNSCNGRRRIEAVQFLDLIGHTITTALFLENRLQAANATNNFDHEQNPPNNDLQALHMNVNAKRQLTQEIEGVFGKGIWLDASRGGVLCLKVNQVPSVPAAEDRLEPAAMKKYHLPPRLTSRSPRLPASRILNNDRALHEYRTRKRGRGRAGVRSG